MPTCQLPAELQAQATALSLRMKMNFMIISIFEDAKVIVIRSMSQLIAENIYMLLTTACTRGAADAATTL